MARRRNMKKTPRRRTPKPMFNVLNTVEGFIVANAGTKAVFGADVIPFLTEGWLRPQSSATNNSWELSLAELASGITGGSFGVADNFTSGGGGLMGAIKYNLARSGPQVATIILTPIAFKLGKKLARQPIAQMNKGIKALGLASTVKI